MSKFIQKIKRKINLTLTHLMIWKIVPSLSGTNITCSGKDDGMGAQVQALYSAILYAHSHQHNYIHTPLKNVAHNYKNEPNWDSKVEHFFSVGLNEKEIADFNGRVVNLNSTSSMVFYLFLFRWFYKSKNVVFQKEHFHEFADLNANNYNFISGNLRSKFFNNQSTQQKHKKQVVVAVHIRRGDVTSENKKRFTTNIELQTKLNKLISFMDNQNIESEVHIYSQGALAEFNFLPKSVFLHLNESPFDDFYNMVTANVLLVAKSSFSYSAALLSQGLIIYEPFWHKPLDSWFIWSDSLIENNRFIRSVKNTI